MHEYGHHIRRQEGNAAWYYMAVAPTSMYNVVTKSESEYSRTWIEIQANTYAYYYFGQPDYWDFKEYPVDEKYIIPQYIKKNSINNGSL